MDHQRLMDYLEHTATIDRNALRSLGFGSLCEHLEGGMPSNQQRDLLLQLVRMAGSKVSHKDERASTEIFTRLCTDESMNATVRAYLQNLVSSDAPTNSPECSQDKAPPKTT